MSFVGTPNCYVCNKKVYPVERMDADKKTFHKYALSLSLFDTVSGLIWWVCPLWAAGVASAVRTAIVR
jgi:hypothetical protein